MAKRKRKHHRFFIQDSDGSAVEWGKADHHHTVDGTLVLDRTCPKLFDDILQSKLSPKSSGFSRNCASNKERRDFYKITSSMLNKCDNFISNTRYFDFDNDLGLEKRFW